VLIDAVHFAHRTAIRGKAREARRAFLDGFSYAFCLPQIMLQEHQVQQQQQQQEQEQQEQEQDKQ
jgi:hypothetical protein